MQSLSPLLDHIDRLRAVHRANLTAAPGDVEQLFDLASQVRVEAAGVALGPMAAPSRLDEPARVQLVAEVLDGAGAVVKRLQLGGEVTRG